MPIVVTVVEANIQHFIGAYLQYLSFRDCPGEVDYRVCIVDRCAERTAPFSLLFDRIGVVSKAQPVRFANPYLNKWLCLDAFPDLAPAQNLILLDWDIIYCGKGVPPDSQNRIRARANPSKAYAEILKNIASQLNSPNISADGGLAISVNAGVIMTNGPLLSQCAQRTVKWEATLSQFHICEFWIKEQVAVSCALAELDYSALEEKWNATSLSEIPEDQIHFWHYSDASPITRQLKKNLTSKRNTTDAAAALGGRWPETMQRFMNLYAKAETNPVLRGFMRQ